jgi:hypothetical protein
MATLRRAMAQGGLLSLLVLHLVLQTGAQGKCSSKSLTATRLVMGTVDLIDQCQKIGDAGLVANISQNTRHDPNMQVLERLNACTFCKMMYVKGSRFCKPNPQIFLNLDHYLRRS